MAGEEVVKPKWYTRPHISSWYALLAVLVGIFAVNACGYPFVTVPSVAQRYYPDVAPAAIRWQPVTVAAVSAIAVIFALPAIQRFGIHVVVYTSASFLLLGGVVRCFAMASPVQDGGAQGFASYAMVHFGSAIIAVALAPFQVAGTLVSATFPRRHSVFVHAMVRALLPLSMPNRSGRANMSSWRHAARLRLWAKLTFLQVASSYACLPAVAVVRF
jgi:hypothetical protein